LLGYAWLCSTIYFTQPPQGALLSAQQTRQQTALVLIALVLTALMLIALVLIAPVLTALVLISLVLMVLMLVMSSSGADFMSDNIICAKGDVHILRQPK